MKSVIEVQIIRFPDNGINHSNRAVLVLNNLAKYSGKKLENLQAKFYT